MSEITVSSAMESESLFRDIPSSLNEEAFSVLVNSNGTRIERIISKGHCSPPDFWYDQEENEWVSVLKGEALLRFEEGDRTVHLKEGGFVNILAHEKHRVEWTKEGVETIWLAVFYK